MSDEITLSSGKTVYANRLILGIDLDLEVYHGYDGEISRDRLTDIEITEICDIAIARWTALKTRIQSP